MALQRRHVGAGENFGDDVDQAAAVNSTLERIFARLQTDKLLRDRLDFTIRRKSAERWTKVYEYQGPDLETAAILNQNRETWTQHPQLFLSISLNPIARVHHPVVYAAAQCLCWERQDAWATMVKRVHRVNLSRVAKEWDMPPEGLAPLLQPYFPWYREDQLIMKIKQLLKEGSMLESWMHDVCSGAVFAFGRQLDTDLWERRIAKQGEPRAAALQHLRSIGYEAFANLFTPMADSILRNLLFETMSVVTLMYNLTPIPPYRAGEQVLDESLVIHHNVPSDEGTLRVNLLGL